MAQRRHGDPGGGNARAVDGMTGRDGGDIDGLNARKALAEGADRGACAGRDDGVEREGRRFLQGPIREGPIPDPR